MITNEFDTIVAISTPLGEDAIGIVRLSETEMLVAVQKVYRGKNLDKAVSHTVNYGHIVDPNTDEVLDEVVVSIMLVPKTFTCENVVEVNTHGGIAVTNGILRLVLRQETRLAELGKFTKRALLNGRADLAQAKAIMDTIHAKIGKAMNITIKQLSGSLSQLINDTRRGILNTLAQVEVSIDYPEYDDVEEMTTALTRGKAQEFQELLENLLHTAKRGKTLREGLFVTIIGCPNVGESSLLSNLSREDKVIVTSIEGTTHDVIEEYINIKSVSLELVDTAGICGTDGVAEKVGVEHSKKAFEEADLVLLMLSSSELLTNQDRAFLELSKDSNRIILLNKTDSPEEIEADQLPDGVIRIPVLKDQNIDVIEERINQLFFDNAGTVEEGTTYPSDARHISLIEKVVRSLQAVNEGLELGILVDLLQIDLAYYWEIPGGITGDAAPDELITKLLSQFCLGKQFSLINNTKRC